jgi:membrane protein
MGGGVQLQLHRKQQTGPAHDHASVTGAPLASHRVDRTEITAVSLVIDWLPRRVGSIDVRSVARETAREVADDDVPGLAAEMAYHSVLALFPFLLLLAGATSLIDNVLPVGDLTQRIVDKAAQVMPDDAVSLIESFTQEVVDSDGGLAILVGLVGSLWAASAAIGSAMKALNRAYDVRERRGFIRRKLVALALTVLFGAMLLLAAGLLSTGTLMAGGIGRALGWKDEAVLAWNILTPFGALALIIFAVAMLYWMAPDTDHSLEWITPGAVLFAVGWVAASVLFTFYVTNFGSYNRTYGSIGAVIVLLVWLYWTNMLLLVGGELNAVLAKRHDTAYKRDASKQRSSGSPAQP